jgi:glucosamine-6-phosphate deaminase
VDVRVVPAGWPWVEAIVAAWVHRLRATPALRMVLGTSAVTVPVYEAMAAAEASWADAEVRLLYELGGLAADHPGRCDAVLRRVLVDCVDLGPGGYRPFDVDAPPRDIGRIGLAVVGLENDGRLGLNEPGSPADSPTRRVTLGATCRAEIGAAVDDDALPSWGVTVGMGPLLAAREVWVLAAGSVEAATVAACVDGAAGPHRPASLLRTHPRCTWWLDAAAARALSPSDRADRRDRP